MVAVVPMSFACLYAMKRWWWRVAKINAERIYSSTLRRLGFKLGES